MLRLPTRFFSLRFCSTTTSKKISISIQGFNGATGQLPIFFWCTPTIIIPHLFTSATVPLCWSLLIGGIIKGTNKKIVSKEIIWNKGNAMHAAKYALIECWRRLRIKTYLRLSRNTNKCRYFYVILLQDKVFVLPSKNCKHSIFKF